MLQTSIYPYMSITTNNKMNWKGCKKVIWEELEEERKGEMQQLYYYI